MKQLSTTDIATAMKNDPAFLGVFALDKIPTTAPPHGKIKMVVNLQASNLPGNHWVAVYRNDEDVGYYFDSFGACPPRAIQVWLSNHCANWTFNNLTIQPFDDNVLCGYLCIEFFKHL